MKRYTLHFKHQLDQWEYTHGSSAKDPRTVALALYLYIHDHYGVESQYFKQLTRKQTLLTETVALDLARSRGMKELFDEHRFTQNYHYLHGVEVNIDLSMVTFTLS